MSSDYTKIFITHDVWGILDALHNRHEIRKEGLDVSVVNELIEYGYHRALDDIAQAVHELVEFTVRKEALHEGEETTVEE